MAAAGISLEHGLTEFTVFGSGHRGGILAHAYAELLFEGVGLRQDVVAYFLGLEGQLVVDFLEPELKVVRETDTFPLEVLKMFLENHLLLAGQAALVGVVDRRHPLVEALVEGNGGGMISQKRNSLLKCGVDLRGLVGLRNIVEHTYHLRKDAAAEFQRSNRVFESGRFGIGDDSVYFGLLLLYSRLDSGDIIGGLDLIERRDAVRGVPFLEERILMTCCKGYCHCEEC